MNSHAISRQKSRRVVRGWEHETGVLFFVHVKLEIPCQSEQTAVNENGGAQENEPKPKSVPILQRMFPSRSSYRVGMDRVRMGD